MTVPRSARSDAGPAIVVICALVATLLAGCSGLFGASPSPTSSAPASSAAPSLDPGQEVKPTASPQYRPGGTAAQNLQYFTAVVDQFQASNGWGWSSAKVVTALGNAGFDPTAIEVTDSKTPNGYQAVSIETSVKIGPDCLIATLRDGRSTVALMAALPTGTCLLDNN